MKNRYWHTLMLFLIRSPMKRAAYLKKHKIFRSVGERVMITPRKIPLYARLIRIGNNVWIASGVEFITHDVTHYMLNGLKDGHRYTEKIGCIDIGDNVFIGSGAKILYDVRIGSNVVVAAGALVTKDVPAGSVVAGVPAKVISSFEDYVEKRRKFQLKHPADNMKQSVSLECEEELWSRFNETGRT
ncbi:MAG: acyltransferase [Lachnospiraceae bacterium]|nr:acyltransferase [Lachnospiraceae bacterium]